MERAGPYALLTPGAVIDRGMREPGSALRGSGGRAPSRDLPRWTTRSGNERRRTVNGPPHVTSKLANRYKSRKQYKQHIKPGPRSPADAARHAAATDPLRGRASEPTAAEAAAKPDPAQVKEGLARYGVPVLFPEGWSAAPLRWVMETVGARQLALLPEHPGLLAAVDQHVAALREAIEVNEETLGDYLLGFVDELRERNWTFTGEPDFATLRLTAICLLARELGHLGDELPA